MGAGKIHNLFLKSGDLIKLDLQGSTAAGRALATRLWSSGEGTCIIAPSLTGCKASVRPYVTFAMPLFRDMRPPASGSCRRNRPPWTPAIAGPGSAGSARFRGRGSCSLTIVLNLGNSASTGNSMCPLLSFCVPGPDSTGREQGGARLFPQCADASACIATTQARAHFESVFMSRAFLRFSLIIQSTSGFRLLIHFSINGLPACGQAAITTLQQ